MSADPLGLHDPGKADLNLYAYVRGMALKAVDPLGLEDFPTQPEGTMPPPPGAEAPRGDAVIGEVTVMSGADAAKQFPGAPAHADGPGREVGALMGTAASKYGWGAATGTAGGAAAGLVCGASVGCGLAFGGAALGYGAYEATKNWGAISSDPHKAFGAITSLAGAGAGASAGQSVGARMRAAIGDAVSGIAARFAPGRAAGGAPKVLMGKQGKHIPGHNNFEPGRSVLRADPESLAARAGTGTQVGKVPVGQPGSKERVVFDDVIGDYIDETGAAAQTRVGIIHYSKDGIHIIPGRPQ